MADRETPGDVPEPPDAPDRPAASSGAADAADADPPPPPAVITILDVAQELGLSVNRTLEICQRLGFDTWVSQDELTSEEADRVRDLARDKVAAEAKAAKSRQRQHRRRERRHHSSWLLTTLGALVVLALGGGAALAIISLIEDEERRTPRAERPTTTGDPGPVDAAPPVDAGTARELAASGLLAEGDLPVAWTTDDDASEASLMASVLAAAGSACRELERRTPAPVLARQASPEFAHRGSVVANSVAVMPDEETAANAFPTLDDLLGDCASEELPSVLEGRLDAEGNELVSFEARRASFDVAGNENSGMVIDAAATVDGRVVALDLRAILVRRGPVVMWFTMGDPASTTVAGLDGEIDEFLERRLVDTSVQRVDEALARTRQTAPS